MCCLYAIQVGDGCFPIPLPTYYFTGDTFEHSRNLVQSPTPVCIDTDIDSGS